MTKAAEQLLQQVMALEFDDRIEFEGRLWDVDAPSHFEQDKKDAAEWEAEIERRTKSFESGEESGIPWRQAMEQIRRGEVDGE